MKVKQASEMTNIELFEELKSRGFFMFDKLKHNCNEHYVLVSIKEPDRNIRITYTLDENMPNANQYIEITCK